MNKAKSLIAYYSRAGSNYVGGAIVDLPVGNTQVVAELIRDMTNGDLFKIETVQHYPADYHETTEVAKKELRQNARPRLLSHLDDISQYGVIFLGYPNWWGTMPMPVYSFLEGCDLSGKIVLPFCTHEGSGMGRSESEIRKLCPGAQVLKGLPLVGGQVRNAEGALAQWLTVASRGAELDFA